MEKPSSRKANTEDDPDIVGQMDLPALGMETIELGRFPLTMPPPHFEVVVRPANGIYNLSYKDIRMKHGETYILFRKFQNFGAPCSVIVRRNRP